MSLNYSTLYLSIYSQTGGDLAGLGRHYQGLQTQVREFLKSLSLKENCLDRQGVSDGVDRCGTVTTVIPSNSGDTEETCQDRK